MQSQSLCHYILWQIPLWSAQFYIYLHTHWVIPTKSMLLTAGVQPAPSDTSLRVIPSEKWKSILAERVKLKNSSCECYISNVPKADMILCSWGQESYERQVISSTHLALSKWCTVPSLSWHVELLSIWSTSMSHSSLAPSQGDTGHCLGCHWIEMWPWGCTYCKAGEAEILEIFHAQVKYWKS